MKKFIVSVIVGGCVGVLMGTGLLFVAPKLPAIFADAFFYPSMQAVSSVNDSFFKSKSKTYTDHYYIDTVDRAIPKEGKVVYADLFSMRIHLYKNGEQVAEYPIKSIGREGTAWQTPLGKFDMSYKRENHFSSFGSVWMPYSMHFFGNYFIHGWPYYDNGAPVAEGYSGGCIRLDTPDSKLVFDFVDQEAQLIVTNSKKPDQEHVLEYQRMQDIPQLESNFIIADINTGEVIASANASTTVPIGSFTKLMTGLISLETLNQYQETIFDQTIVTVADLIYPLLLEDDTEAAELLYKHKHKAQYLIDMNTRAESLGMSDTEYKDVNGTDIKTVSTLDDTMRLLMYFNEYKPFIFKVLSQKEYTKNSLNIQHQIYATEGFYSSGFVNSAGTSMITLFDHKVNYQDQTRESVPKKLVIIIQDSRDTRGDAEKLYSWFVQSVALK